MKRCAVILALFLAMLAASLAACAAASPVSSPAATTTSSPSTSITPTPTIPHEADWGIYSLDLASGGVSLLYTTDSVMRKLDLDPTGRFFAFSSYLTEAGTDAEEIFTVPVTGGAATRLTDNDVMDTYPVWSPGRHRFIFLSWRDATLDIYVMEHDGTDQQLFYDSGGHDGDLDWVGSTIAFTADHRIWLMDDDGTNPRSITDPPRAGEWGNANLPFGDYDPRLSPDGKMVVFERLMDDISPHGNYDFFLVNADGTGETRLTDTGYSQGFAAWSPDGSRLVLVVAAIGEQGVYRLYAMDRDGSNYGDITPAYFPAGFLCHDAVFSADGASVYFIGQWWR
jgi:Tol biopolymer transport system component